MRGGGGALTGDADMGFAALGGPRGAPGHTLTPEVLGPKQLLHLLPSDLDAGLSHYQACGGRQDGLKGRERAERTRPGRRDGGKRGRRRKVLAHIRTEHGEQVKMKN